MSDGIEWNAFATHVEKREGAITVAFHMGNAKVQNRHYYPLSLEDAAELKDQLEAALADQDGKALSPGAKPTRQ